MSSGSSYILDSNNGEITDGGSLVTTARLIDASSPRFVSEVVASIEQSWPSSNVVPDGTDEIYYISIYDSVSATVGGVSEDLVVGFARLRIARSGATITLTRESQAVGAENATSLPAIGWQSTLRTQLQNQNVAYQGLGTDDQSTALGDLITSAFTQSQTISDSHDGLRTPALVRSME